MKQLVITNLFKTYKKRCVVNNVSFSMNPGEIVGLLGPNGAGKTTSFYMVIGLVNPDSGAVCLNDVDITKLPIFKRVRMGLGYLPQEASVFRKLNVEDNISLVLENSRFDYYKRKDRLEYLIERFGLEKIRKNSSSTISGGERRRIEIARTLALEPDFILLDEPLSGIDPIAVTEIQEIVKELSNSGIGILITDHNVRETLSICDRAYLLNQGVIEVAGSAEELISNEKAKKFYFGESFKL